MSACTVCGSFSGDLVRCPTCQLVSQLVLDMEGPLVVFVDGSALTSRGGAGFVLVRDGVHGEEVTRGLASFRCRGSVDAEYQAIVRASRWAPGVMCLSDCTSAIELAYQQGIPVRYVAKRERTHHYTIAHRLSSIGRKYPPGAVEHEKMWLKHGRAPTPITARDIP